MSKPKAIGRYRLRQIEKHFDVVAWGFAWLNDYRILMRRTRRGTLRVCAVRKRRDTARLLRKMAESCLCLARLVDPDKHRSER